MTLPSDYPEFVLPGVEALHTVASQLRAAATTHVETPDLWLAVRDVESLAARLSGDEWLWENGFGDFWINGQDLGVLDELVAGNIVLLGGASFHIAPPDSGKALVRLRDFLARRQKCA